MINFIYSSINCIKNVNKHHGNIAIVNHFVHNYHRVKIWHCDSPNMYRGTLWGDIPQNMSVQIIQYQSIKYQNITIWYRHCTVVPPKFVFVTVSYFGNSVKGSDTISTASKRHCCLFKVSLSLWLTHTHFYSPVHKHMHTRMPISLHLISFWICLLIRDYRLQSCTHFSPASESFWQWEGGQNLTFPSIHTDSFSPLKERKLQDYHHADLKPFSLRVFFVDGGWIVTFGKTVLIEYLALAHC